MWPAWSAAHLRRTSRKVQHGSAFCLHCAPLLIQHASELDNATYWAAFLQGLGIMKQASKPALRELRNEKQLVQWAPGQASHMPSWGPWA